MATPPLDATRLAADRTRLALERTLMAWIRTSTSLIAFGFTIFNFSQILREAATEQVREHTLNPHLFAILMILLGLIILTLAWVQHRQQMKALKEEFGAMPYSLAGVITIFIGGLGIIALIQVNLKL